MKPTPADKREVNLHSKIKLPKDRYTLRIKDEEFKMSAAGNPMIILTPEFVSPDSFVAADGSTVNIAGVELNKEYITLRTKDKETGEVDLVKSQKMFDRYADLRAKLGVPIDDEGVDIENPPKVFKGLVISAICDSEESAQRKEPTVEQRSKGQLGDILKDDDGNEIKFFRSKVVTILGLGSANVAGATKPF